ncbi:MAG: hypothetical protein IJU84_02105 [Clostridia bacterium]|nr:hypothetical protein [Clostridia bacterium]MBQ9480941.1 hypothetical protein [Clostridia bacterium]
MKKLLCLLIACAVLFGIAGCKKEKIPVDSSAETSVAASEQSGEETPSFTVRDKLSACMVNILLAVEEAPYDAANVEIAVNNQLKKDGKPYTVHFEYTQQANYAVTVGDYCRRGYDGAWAHITTIQSMIEQEIVKTDIMPYVDKYGKKIKEEVSASAFAQFTDYKTGKLYAVPRDMPTANDRLRVTLRADWMARAGMEKVTSVEELDRYLSWCKTNITRENFYPLMLGELNSHLTREYCPSYYFPISDNNFMVYVDIESKPYKVRSFYNTEAFEAWVAKATEYFTLGYTTNKSISSTEQQFYNGLTAALPSYSTVKMSERVDAFKLINDDGELYESFIEDEDNPKVVFFAADNCMVALSQSEHTEEFIDFLNWTKDQAHHDLVTLGVKGVNYYLNEKGRTTYVNPDKPSEKIPLEKRFAIYNPYYAYNDVDYQRFSANLSDEYVESVKNMEKDDEAGNPLNYVISPLCGFNIKETAEYKTAYNKMISAAAMFSTLANGMGKGDTTVQALITSVNKDKCMENLISIVQKQIDEYVAAKGL